MSPLVRLVTQCFHTCNINCRLVLVSPETSQHVFSDLAWTPMCPMRDTRWYVTSLCLMNGDKLQMSSCASTRAMSSSHAGPRQSMELRSVATCKLLWWTSHLARRSFHQLRVRRDKWSPWAPTAVSTVKTEASCEARGSSHQRQITLNVGQPKCVLLLWCRPLFSPVLPRWHVSPTLGSNAAVLLSLLHIHLVWMLVCCWNRRSGSYVSNTYLECTI